MAPSVRRTAVSRWRVAALASNRFATFAHAINSTTAATPSCTPIAAVIATPPIPGARTARTLHTAAGIVPGRFLAILRDQSEVGFRAPD